MAWAVQSSGSETTIPIFIGKNWRSGYILIARVALAWGQEILVGQEYDEFSLIINSLPF